MNVICDLTQFVVSTPTYNITAENLAKLFMEEVFLNFRMCAVIVIDDGGTFKGTFQKTCKALLLPIGESKEETVKETVSRIFTNF